MKSGTRFRKTVISRAAIAALWGTAAMAASQETLAQQASLERVEITGSSIRRVDAETALPVQVIGRDEIQRSGATSTEDLLSTITAASSSGGINNATGAGVSTYGQSSISLRGLGSSRTLVLVNGRRLAPFAADGSAVNVNAIPLSAVERVEVLKDGASSLYGSDAMAGVVNFILRKSFQGIELSAGGGTPTHKGGGQNGNASITGGFGDGDRFSAVLSASYEKDKVLQAKDRWFSTTGNRAPYYTAGATGQGNIEGAITGAYPNDRYTGSAGPGPNGTGASGFGTSPGTGYGNPLALANQCETVQMFKNPTTSTKGAPYCAFDSNHFVGLMPDRKLWNLTGNATFKMSQALELFGDALWSRSTVDQAFQASPLRRSFLVTDSLLTQGGNEPALVIQPTNPNYPTAYLTQMGYTSLIGKPLAITSRVFDFGGRQQSDESTQARLVAGARGTIANQDYELAGTFNENKIAGRVTGGYFSQLQYAQIIDSSNSWNPWAPGGVQTGALADQLKAAEYKGPTLNARSRTESFDGTLRGDVMPAPGGTAQYAAGLQLRRESLLSSPSPALETGDIAGLGGGVPPVDRDRRITSYFSEVNVPVMKQLELNGSARHDRYNDVGGATTYKANARWQPTQALLLRGSLGTGFRAPTLIDLWTPQTLGTSEQFCDPATNQCSLQVNAITGGNPNLKPEKSKQNSLGFVLAPSAGLTVGIDYFHYKIRDILATPTAQEIVSRFRAGDPAYRDLIVLAGNDVDTVKEVTANVGSAVVSGFDVFGNFRQALAGGRVDVNFNGTYMSKFDQTSAGGAVSHKVGTLVEPDGTPVIGTNPTTLGQGVVLRWQHHLSGSYKLGDWTTTVTQHFTKRYRAGNDLNDNPTYVGSYSIMDLNVSYGGVKNLLLSVGARNVFDKQPAIFVPTSNQFQSGYDVAQYDPRGRFVYAKATYLFR